MKPKINIHTRFFSGPHKNASPQTYHCVFLQSYNKKHGPRSHDKLRITSPALPGMHECLYGNEVQTL